MHQGFLHKIDASGIGVEPVHELATSWVMEIDLRQQLILLENRWPAAQDPTSVLLEAPLGCRSMAKA